MKTIYELKPAFQNLLRPICQSLAKQGITANQVTLAALVCSFVVGGLILWQPGARWPLLVVPVFLFVRMALNAIDGMMAREHNMKSKEGAVLNELGDVLSDAALYLPFAFVPGIPALWVVVIVILAIISEMTGVIAVQIGASRRYDGPMGKSDRAFAFGLIALLLGCGVPVGHWIPVALGVMVGLLVRTIINRVKGALQEAR